MSIQDDFLAVDGVRLHWQALGSGQPAVVLLHGLNDCFLAWRRVAPELAKDRRVLVPDLAGHGLSARPDAPYTIAWHTQLIGRWLSQVEPGAVDIVGHSLGGEIGMHLLAEGRVPIRRLALVSVGGPSRRLARAARWVRLAPLLERLAQPFMATGTRIAMHDVLPKEECDQLCAINGMPDSARAFARTLGGIVDARELWPDLTGNQTPIAMFCGDRDPFASLDETRALSARWHAARFEVFSDCGHRVPQQMPRALTERLRAFLA